MATYTQPLTGPGHTDRFGFLSTGLGFTARTKRGSCISIFGDRQRSPIGLRHSNTDIDNGIVWDTCVGGREARQMIEYTAYDEAPARADLGCPIIEIPSDAIHLPDGRYIMTTYGVRDWGVGPDGIASLGGSWRTWYTRQWTSTDTHAENWVSTWNLESGRHSMDFWNYGDLWSHFQNTSMIMWPGEPFIYFYGTNEGRWNGGGIHLMRVSWDRLWYPSSYAFWGVSAAGVWDWRQAGPSTPIIMPTFQGNAIGEISANVIDGMVVLSYIDGVVGAVTRVAPYPTGLWSMPKIQVFPTMAPGLYAPAVHPFSRLDSAQFLLSDDSGVSQWSGSVNGLYFVGGSFAEELVVTAHRPARDGYRGPLAPRLGRLRLADRVAVLSEVCDGAVSHAELAHSLLG